MYRLKTENTEAMEKNVFEEKIEKYYAGEMSDAEKEQFFDALRGDPLLKEAFDLRIALKDSITAYLDIEEVKQDVDLKSILAEFENERRLGEQPMNKELLDFIQGSVPASRKMIVEPEITPPKNAIKTFSKKSKSATFYLWTSLLAASVALLIFVSVSSLGVTADELYDSYYERFEPIGVTYRSTEERGQVFKDALDDFRTGNAEKAIASMLSISAPGPLEEELAFYLPLAYMDNEEYTKAVSGFEDYLASHEKFVFEARWYLSLAYIQLEEKDKAREHLSELAERNSSYQKRAGELLSRLDKMKK